MRFEFDKSSIWVGIHLYVFAKFTIPYQLETRDSMVILSIDDDLSPMLIFDIGLSVGYFDMELARLSEDTVWPIERSLSLGIYKLG